MLVKVFLNVSPDTTMLSLSACLCTGGKKWAPPSASQCLSKGEPRHYHAVLSVCLCIGGEKQPTRASQGLSKGEPRHGHPVVTNSLIYVNISSVMLHVLALTLHCLMGTNPVVHPITSVLCGSPELYHIYSFH